MPEQQHKKYKKGDEIYIADVFGSGRTKVTIDMVGANYLVGCCGDVERPFIVDFNEALPPMTEAESLNADIDAAMKRFSLDAERINHELSLRDLKIVRT